MENDDLFEIIEPSEDNNADASESEFVQDESFVNSLDFQNGFSDVSDEDVDNILNSMDDDLGLSNDETATENKEEIPETFDKSDVPEEYENPDTDGFSDSEGSDNDETSVQEDDDLGDIDDDYEQTMVITEDTAILGSISTDSSLDIFGSIEGDIFCKGKLSISGKVKGNSHADEVMINAQRTEGNVECTGVVKIGQGSVVIGDINAGAAVIAGAVKGTLDVKGPVILDSTAVIKGNIKAKSVQLINGAVLEGFCSVENPQVDDIFN